VADQLRMIEEAGSTRPAFYAVRDVRGVEPVAAVPAERVGFNEAAEWTERADKAINNEHRAAGTHGGYKFPAAIVILSVIMDGSSSPGAFSIDGESWREGVYQRDVPFVSLDPVDWVLTFTNPWLPDSVVGCLEGPGWASFEVISATQIRINRTSNSASLTGGHSVLTFWGVV
jgi:hypothetical protein